MVAHLDVGAQVVSTLRGSAVIRGAPQDLRPATQGKRNWYPGAMLRGRMKTQRPAPLQGLRPRILTGGGGATCFSFAGTQ